MQGREVDRINPNPTRIIPVARTESEKGPRHPAGCAAHFDNLRLFGLFGGSELASFSRLFQTGGNHDQQRPLPGDSVGYAFQAFRANDGSSSVVSCPITGSAIAASRLVTPFHWSAGLAFPSEPIWSMPQ
jgi:hypothetical protein